MKTAEPKVEGAQVSKSHMKEGFPEELPGLMVDFHE